MSWRNWCISAALALAAFTAFSGKRGNTSAQSATGAKRNEPAPSAAGAPMGSRPTHARPRRVEGPLSTYHNPQYGVSFQYPRNFALDEGEPEESSEVAEEHKAEQTGETLLATVLIPDDAYPNTNFEHGELRLLVSNSSDEGSCREDTRTSENHRRAADFVTTAEGIPFSRSGEVSSVAGQQRFERKYAAFFQGQCYAFEAAVELRESSTAEGATEKAADSAKILKQLEKIVVSARLESRGSGSDGALDGNGVPRL